MTHSSRATAVSASLFALSIASLALPAALSAQSREDRVEVHTVIVGPISVAPISVAPAEPKVVTQPAPAPRAVQIRWATSWYPGTVVQTVWGPYTLVRFDGYGPEWDSVVHERDLRAAGAPTAATQPDVPGVEMPEQHVIRRREALMGEWHGSWFPVRVLSARGDGSQGARVRYDGYGPEWDENLSRARLRLRDADSDPAEQRTLTGTEGAPAEPQSPPRVGQSLAVRQGPSWRAAVLRGTDGPLFLVHYRGTTRAHDEPVTLDRIRVL